MWDSSNCNFLSYFSEGVQVSQKEWHLSSGKNSKEMACQTLVVTVDVNISVFVLVFCVNEPCVLFQRDSPSTSRQSPANGHSSTNNSVSVRTLAPHSQM